MTLLDAFDCPHQSFPTGDQLGADDVAELLPDDLMPTGEALLGAVVRTGGQRCPRPGPATVALAARRGRLAGQDIATHCPARGRRGG